MTFEEYAGSNYTKYDPDPNPLPKELIFTVTWSEESSRYTAQVDKYPLVTTYGSSLVEALKEIITATQQIEKGRSEKNLLTNNG